MHRGMFLASLGALAFLATGALAQSTIHVPADQPTIQAAIDAAAAGDVIQIAAGTYAENFNVTKQLSLVGAGSGADPLSNTVITQTPAGAGDTRIGVAQLSASGASTAAPILLQDLRLEPVGMAGISVGRFTEATGQTVAYVTLDNVHVVGTNTNPSTEQERGLYVDLTSTLSYLDVVDCAFDDLTYGWYFQKEVSADASTVQYVTVAGTTFNHNNHKGLYAEKLADATFTGCTFDANGYDSSILPSYFAPWSCGVDVNLKAGTYANLAFVDCTVTDNATDQSKEGVGLTVKARGTGNDASYASFPAYVDNVLISGGVFTGNERGIRLGEPSKQHTTPTNVTITGATIAGNTQHYSGSDGSLYGDLVNMADGAGDAAGNWWGDLDPSDQVAAESGLPLPVFAPWLGAAPGTTPMTWYVDPSGTIQAAIDAAAAGDEIVVAAGTYEEQLHIAKALTITGAGAGTTTVLAPATLALCWTTSYPHYAVVFVDATTATLRDLAIDGAGRGNSHYRFVGVGFRNAGGAVDGCAVLGVRDTPFSGAQHGVAIYSYNDDTVARDIDVTDCALSGFQKNALALNAADDTPLDVLVTGNTITGAGPTAVTAQNGIQVWGDQNTGLVGDNAITGIAYDGSGWVASSILNYYADLDVVDNAVDVAHVGIYDIDGAGTIAGNVLEISKYAGYGWGIIASDPPQAVPSPFADTETKDRRPAQKATLAVTVSGNTVTFVGPDNAGTYGIEGDAGYGPDDLALAINDNLVSGFDVGIEVWQCQDACDTGVFTAVDARRNNVAGNTSFGVRSNADYLTVDATDCWWGDPSGPSGAGSGSGVPVSPFIDFDPWRGGVIVTTPDPLDLTVAAPTAPLAVSYLGGYGPVYGYSVTVLWDAAVATATFARPASGPFAAGSTLFQVVTVPGGRRIDGALNGSQAGITAGDLFQATFTAVGGEGASTVVDLTVEYLSDYGQPPVYGVPADDGLVRVDTGLPVVAGVLITDTTIASTDWVKDGDTITVTATVTDAGGLASVTCDLTAFGGGGGAAPDGPPAGDVYTWTFAPVTGSSDGPATAIVTAFDGLGNSATGSDAITADNTAPDAVTGVAARPGHNQIHLSWDDPSGLDDHLAGVEFRWVAWGDYPTYAGSLPAAPADHTGGDLALQTTGTAADWPRTGRDIYVLAGFAYDLAGNYGPAESLGGNADAATNYFLGDVTPEPSGDGDVDIIDVSRLGDTYGLVSTDIGFLDFCDVGPTDDWSRFGLPEPDLVIGFFDLMIFAMNFGEVTPSTKSDGAIGTPVFAWERTDADTWALVLTAPTAGLKGMNVTGDLPSGVSCTVQPGELLGDQDAPVFLRNVERHGLDAGLAVLGFGEGLAGSGTLLVVKTSRPVDDLAIAISARDLNNEELLAEIGQTTGVALPTVHSLAQNHPNPFNPQTTIEYALPRAEDVRLAVYGVDGRLVRVLVDERREAGRHETVWRGEDEAGRRVATGTYFYVLDAGDFHQVRKLSLIK